MASPPHSGVGPGNVVGSSNPGGAVSLHDHHAQLLMQQQQQVDYYQNPAAIYSQMQSQQAHYGNGGGGGSADLLATQQYLANLQLGGGDPNLDGSGKRDFFIYGFLMHLFSLAPFTEISSAEWIGDVDCVDVQQR